MTHCVMAMLVATLLQPPVAPAKQEPTQKVIVDGLGPITFDVAVPIVTPAVTHPDIRVAEARLMEAQAMLDQAKLKVATEVAMNKAKFDQARADVATKAKEFDRLDALHKSGAVSVEEHAKVVAELQTAKRQLAFAELLTQVGKEATQAPKAVDSIWGYRGNYTFEASPVVPNATQAQSQPLQDLLQRKVKLAVKATDADNSVIGVLERCMKEWDFAAAKVIARYPQASKAVLKDAPFLHPVEGENTVGVWLLLMLDEFNNQTDRLYESSRGKHQIYVREYGLLFTLVKNAPDGAPTLAEFLRQAKK